VPLKNRRLFVIFWGLFILWGFGVHTVWARLTIDIHGVVTSSIDDPSTSAPRYSTIYTIRSDDGRKTQYVAGPTDASLARSLPVGSRVDKDQWQLDYRVNGRRASFPIGFYAAVIVFGLGAVAIGLFELPDIWRSRKFKL
jgi:hypothetical protein